MYSRVPRVIKDGPSYIVNFKTRLGLGLYLAKNLEQKRKKERATGKVSANFVFISFCP